MTKIRIIIDLPDEFENYFSYIEANFSLSRELYLESLIEKEIISRNSELGLF